MGEKQIKGRKKARNRARRMTTKAPPPQKKVQGAYLVKVPLQLQMDTHAQL